MHARVVLGVGKGVLFREVSSFYIGVSVCVCMLLCVCVCVC